jgi:hypothetical protein
MSLDMISGSALMAAHMRAVVYAETLSTADGF